MEAGLKFEGELTASRFGGLGRPSGAYSRGRVEVVALVSTFDPFYWPGRTCYEGHKLRHRVSLYSSGFGRRLGVWDQAQHRINDLVFHPTQPVLVVATGQYDGGYCFYGELLSWNWESNRTAKILAENRCFTRVGFNGDGTLNVLFRPHGDTMHGDEDHVTPFYGGRVRDLRPFEELGLAEGEPDPRIASFPQCQPGELGFTLGERTDDDHQLEWQSHLDETGFAARHRVWDLAWPDESRIFATHDGCWIEEWTPEGECRVQLRGEGNGVQILTHEERVYVQVVQRTRNRNRAQLLRYLPGELRCLHRFDHATVMSIDAAGNLLCRNFDDGGRGVVPRDKILDTDGRVLVTAGNGRPDSFNDYIRLEAVPGHFHLHAPKAPCSEVKLRTLCTLDLEGRRTPVMRWQMTDRPEALLQGNVGGFLPDGSLARAYKVYSAGGLFEGYLERIELPSNRMFWRQPLDALVVAMTPLAGRNMLVCVLTNGRLLAVDWRTGEILHDEAMEVGGVATVGMSLASRAGVLLCGTIDGRLLRYRVGA
jgi:hypothetical protein